MEYLKTFENYNNKTNDFMISVFIEFIRLLKLHELYFYKKTLMSDNKDFKKEFSSILNNHFKKFETMNIEKLIQLVKKYESELYNDEKLTTGDHNSLYEVIVELFEEIDDEDDLKNKWFVEFSDEDIYADNQREEYDFDDDIVDFEIETNEDVTEFGEIGDTCDEIRNKLMAKLDEISHQEFIKLYISELKKLKKNYTTDISLKYIDWEISEWSKDLND